MITECHFARDLSEDVVLYLIRQYSSLLLTRMAGYELSDWITTFPVSIDGVMREVIVKGQWNQKHLTADITMVIHREIKPFMPNG